MSDSKNGNKETLNDRLRFLEELHNLPEIPEIITEALIKLKDPDVSFEELETLIKRDLGLEAFLMRIASSPPFGNSEDELVSQAITKLGLANFRSLLTIYAGAFLYKAVKDPVIRQQLWEHAISVAVLAKIIGGYIPGVDSAVLFDCGLLHDIGKILLFLHDAETFKNNLHLREESGDIADQEFELFGFSHIETGHFLLTRLEFPREVRDAVLFHHNPEFSPPGSQPVWILALANELCYLLDDPTNRCLYRFFVRLNLTKARLVEIAEEGKATIRQYLSLF